MKEYLIYEGEYFSAEWYFDEFGESEALEFFETQSVDKQAKILALIKLLCDHGQIRNITKFRNEGDKIYAFKPQPDRYLSFFTKDKKIVITNAFVKKSQKLPRIEKDKALERMRSYLIRARRGEYYEEE